MQSSTISVKVDLLPSVTVACCSNTTETIIWCPFRNTIPIYTDWHLQSDWWSGRRFSYSCALKPVGCRLAALLKFPWSSRNFLRALISWTTKDIDREEHGYQGNFDCLFCRCHWSNTFFESSCLVLRVDIADKTFCKSNHFGSCDSPIKGECIVTPILYSPSSTINFAVYCRFILYLV